MMAEAVTLAILAGGEGRRMGGPKGWLRVAEAAKRRRDGATKGVEPEDSSVSDPSWPRRSAASSLPAVPILSWLHERFAWPGPTLLVTAPGRAHPPGWEAFDLEVQDAAAGEGPLRGVLGALEHAPTPVVVVAVVDMPGMTREALAWLAERVGEEAKIRGAGEKRRDEETERGSDSGSSFIPHPSPFGRPLAMMTRRGGSEEDGRIEPFPSAWRREAAELVRGELAAGRRGVVALAEGAGKGVIRVIDAPAWPEELWTNLNEPGDVKAWEERG